MVCSTLHAYADAPIFSGRFSKDSVEVGDQVEYIMDVEVDRATYMQFPSYGDGPKRDSDKAKISTYTKYDEDALEFLSDYDTDTIKVDGRRLTLRKRYRFAAMETGDLSIVPVLLYQTKNHSELDTIYAERRAVLHVKRYEQLDTLNFMSANMFTAPGAMSQPGAQVDPNIVNKHLKTKGIITQQDMPFILEEIEPNNERSKLWLYILIGVAVVAIALFVVWYLRRRRLLQTEVGVVLLPPHVEANKALVELHHRKLWQNGNFKAYYTQLSMILRRYVSRRWEVQALESTTNELIAILRGIDMPGLSRDNLIEILRTADMVKFAKAEPEAEHNEECYTMAYYFVENTKLEEIAVDKDKEDITIDTKIGD
jgi:hypothetical protein